MQFLSGLRPNDRMWFFCHFYAFWPHVGQKVSVTLVFVAGARFCRSMKAGGFDSIKGLSLENLVRCGANFFCVGALVWAFLGSREGKAEVLVFGSGCGKTCCGDGSAALGRESNSSSKKACVTASARVWYLEPKWLRYMSPASM